MRRGLYGGTFDPPHAAHLAVARTVRDALGLDLVELVPARVPPHRAAPAASAEDRLAMLACAVGDEARLVPSRRELDRSGRSYTVETLREILAASPGDELFLVIGADSYDELPAWRAADEIQRLAHLAVLPRPGCAGFDRPRAADVPRLRRPGEPPPADGCAVYAIEMPPLPIAARDIRAALARGEDPGAGVLPRPVFEYIAARGLYGWPR